MSAFKEHQARLCTAYRTLQCQQCWWRVLGVLDSAVYALNHAIAVLVLTTYRDCRQLGYLHLENMHTNLEPFIRI